jgi:lysophospholipid acyltransferase (LPLAT)-like uncharacterized protein
MKIRSRWVSKLAAWLMVTGFRCLVGTCRVVSVAADRRWLVHTPEGVANPEALVCCVWHDALILPTFTALRAMCRKTCCLVSRHQDGGYLADSMALLEYTTVRGSSSKGGAAAVKQLIADTAGKHIVITPDGPRGPRRVLKAGPVYVASQTGRRLICAAYACRSGWRIRGSWTDMLIPRPFTTIFAVVSEPITIPSDLSREQLAVYVGIVQREMDRLQEMADEVATGRTVDSARMFRAAA